MWDSGGQHCQNALRGLPGHRCRAPFTLWLLLWGQRSLSAVPPAEQLLPARAKSAARPSAPTCHLSRRPRCLAATLPCQVLCRHCQHGAQHHPHGTEHHPQAGSCSSIKDARGEAREVSQEQAGIWVAPCTTAALSSHPPLHHVYIEPKGHENGVQPRAEGTRGAAEWLSDSEAPSASRQRLFAQGSAGKRCPVPSRWRRGDGGCGGAVLVPPARPAPGCGNGAVAPPACISPATPLSAAFHIDYNSWFWLCFFCPFNNICCLGEERQGTPPTGACTAPGPEGCGAAPHCPQPPVPVTALELHPNWEKPLCHGLVLLEQLSPCWGLPSSPPRSQRASATPKSPTCLLGEPPPGLTCAQGLAVSLHWCGAAARIPKGWSLRATQAKQTGRLCPRQTAPATTEISSEPRANAAPCICAAGAAHDGCSPGN